jgi:hypothetical protein
MKTRYTVALSICAGAAVGAAAGQALHAEAKAPTYVLSAYDRFETDSDLRVNGSGYWRSPLPHPSPRHRQ